jgi:sec-independent protein translocase protein TatA
MIGTQALILILSPDSAIHPVEALFGTQDIILILLIVLVLFGAKKLPELARGLGQGINEFKKAQAGMEEEFKNAIHQDTPPQTKPTTSTTPTVQPPSLLDQVAQMNDADKAKLAELLNASKKN